MSDAEEAHDDIQVGAAAGVNDPGDIPCRMTECSAGGEDMAPAKVAKGQGGQANVTSDGLMTCGTAKKKRRSGSVKNSAVMMIIIAFITFKSSLVPLIEGLCSSSPCGFEFSGFRRNRTNSPSL